MNTARGQMILSMVGVGLMFYSEEKLRSIRRGGRTIISMFDRKSRRQDAAGP